MTFNSFRAFGSDCHATNVAGVALPHPSRKSSADAGVQLSFGRASTPKTASRPPTQPRTPRSDQVYQA
ncbi:hypothetical protein PSTG_12927 [Puccinia striiformis f. sp. tritici PST-78]|uniref:Uncharacterized protein n=1 Tax=Puccinia striiformis f. sp. tritici PST-78 TaxID=1165861 RepID=A0A0L0V367_9BASI|nr:hypothetical protein PSTG_12927 [Puccinia striiformis f. sp. tritici PST-78]